MGSFEDVLGVSRNASPDEIKSAWRKLALDYHPDRNKSPEAEDMFKKVNDAYTSLTQETSFSVDSGKVTIDEGLVLSFTNSELRCVEGELLFCYGYAVYSSSDQTKSQYDCDLPLKELIGYVIADRIKDFREDQIKENLEDMGLEAYPDEIETYRDNDTMGIAYFRELRESGGTYSEEGYSQFRLDSGESRASIFDLLDDPSLLPGLTVQDKDRLADNFRSIDRLITGIEYIFEHPDQGLTIGFSDPSGIFPNALGQVDEVIQLSTAEYESLMNYSGIFLGANLTPKLQVN